MMMRMNHKVSIGSVVGVAAALVGGVLLGSVVVDGFVSNPSSPCQPNLNTRQPQQPQQQQVRFSAVNDNQKSYANDQLGENDDALVSVLQGRGAVLGTSRRNMIVQSMAGLTAEAAWRQAVTTASASAADATSTTSNTVLPKGTIESLEQGRAVVIPNFLTADQCATLRQDAQYCFRDANQFSKFVYNKQGQQMDIWQMPSFFKKKDIDGPFVDSGLGNFDARQNLKATMASVKSELGRRMFDRASMLTDNTHTHEIEYLRYGAGASLLRHTDEHHIELLYPGGSERPKKPTASRRSITWLLYLNEPDWNTQEDGGQLRLYQRTLPSQNPVGARGKHLQIGWLKSMPEEQPVFLDPNYAMDGTLATLPAGANPKDQKTCMLYTLDPKNNNQRINLSKEPFPNAALYLPGGDVVARKFMFPSPLEEDVASKFHLIDAPKSVLTQSLSLQNSDGGETHKDVPPTVGTLVVFDSVSMPHEVLITNRERWAVQGWFHEKLV